jgi:hypothetical protein
MKNVFNCLAKVVAKNKDDKDIVQIYRMSLVGNVLSYKEMKEIEPLDWEIAKKEFNVVGMIH